MTNQVNLWTSVCTYEYLIHHAYNQMTALQLHIALISPKFKIYTLACTCTLVYAKIYTIRVQVIHGMSYGTYRQTFCPATPPAQACPNKKTNWNVGHCGASLSECMCRTWNSCMHMTVIRMWLTIKTQATIYETKSTDMHNTENG